MRGRGGLARLVPVAWQAFAGLTFEMLPFAIIRDDPPEDVGEIIALHLY